MKKISKIFTLFIFLLGFGIGVFLPAARALPEKIYKALDIFSKVLFIVQKDYVEPVNGQDLVYGAIKGMLGTLDPYTVFLTPDVYKELKIDTVGRFGGVGIEISMKDGILTIVSPLEDSPAARAGVKAGDRILKINGTPTKGMNLADAVRKMRGDSQSKIVLTLGRQGLNKPLDVTLTREIIKIKSVRFEWLASGNIAYIRLGGFQEETLEELNPFLNEIKDSKAKGIIIDLRNNPGGLFDQAVSISDRFLASGNIVSTRDRNGKSEVQIAKANATDLLKRPIVVLVNKGSASASEILAGALQDNGRAKVLGTQSFGKGSVQTVIDLGEETGLKITIARYYSPSGRVIDGKGIKPDFIVDSEKVLALNPELKASEDEQIQAALDYLLKGKTPPSKPAKSKSDQAASEDGNDTE